QYAMGDVAFSSAERDRHLGIRPVSQLNTWPVVSPVNASRRPSRDAAHHSGLGRLARPFPWGTFTSYSLPACLAHSRSGHSLQIVGRRKSVHARNAPKATVGHQSVVPIESWKPPLVHKNLDDLEHVSTGCARRDCRKVETPQTPGMTAYGASRTPLRPERSRLQSYRDR